MPKTCKLTPIRETKTPCNWKSKWVPDSTYTIPKISNFFDKKNIGNKVMFSETLPWIGSERCTRRTSELFRTSSDIFGCLRKSLENFGYVRVVFRNPGTLQLKISRLWLRKSWQVYWCHSLYVCHVILYRTWFLSCANTVLKLMELNNCRQTCHAVIIIFPYMLFKFKYLLYRTEIII